MTGKRTHYGTDFKAKIALEAIRGALTTSQLATKHGVHQTLDLEAAVPNCADFRPGALRQTDREVQQPSIVPHTGSAAVWRRAARRSPLAIGLGAEPFG
jgi:hypothetical protein